MKDLKAVCVLDTVDVLGHWVTSKHSVRSRADVAYLLWLKRQPTFRSMWVFFSKGGALDYEFFTYADSDKKVLELLKSLVGEKDGYFLPF